MRVILNILWLVLSGFWLALGYLTAAVLMFVLIITIPFGLQAVKLAIFALWPFGRTLVKRPGAGAPSLIGNLLWLVLAGWWLALGHLVSGVLLCLHHHRDSTRARQFQTDPGVAVAVRT